MEQNLRVKLTAALLAMTCAAAAGCDDFLTVENRNVVDAGAIDPVADAVSLANSALQDYRYAYVRYASWGGWFTGETLCANVNWNSGNMFGIRQVSPSAGYVDYPHAFSNPAPSSYFEQVARAWASSARVIQALAGTEGESANINLAMAEMVSGYSFLTMAEYFCMGVVDGGPALNTGMMLDSAVTHFTRAMSVASAAGTDQATQFWNASVLGRARAQLQAGDNVQARADAEMVEEGFEYFLTFIDDPANLGRVSNFIWDHSRISTISVAPHLRNLDDPRVVAIPPGEHPFNPNDGVTELWTQGKYTSYSSPMRLASNLEAEYIVAEATGPDAMMALIQRERTANGQPPYAGPTDGASVLEELFEQRGREFWLEARRMGDFRRHPEAVNYVPETGTPYHKPALGLIGSQMCWPLPDKEVLNNENLRPGG
jgi:hypothetical protein